jgi:hypothetical protein
MQERTPQFENRLNEMTSNSAPEIELASQMGETPHSVLLNRLLGTHYEDAPSWEEEERHTLSKMIAAFGVVAHEHLTPEEQDFIHQQFIEKYDNNIVLDEEEVLILQRLGQRVGIEINTTQNVLSIEKVAGQTPQRIRKLKDPVIDDIFEKANSEEDKIGFLLKELPGLTLTQKVRLLLDLSDEEFDEYKRKHNERQKSLAEYVKENPNGTFNTQDRAVTNSRLQNAVAREIAEAELRRRWGDDYPAEWDAELQEDPRFRPNDDLPRFKDGQKLTYEEAIEYSKFLNAQDWYKNIFFPLATRADNPIPITTNTIYETFRRYREKILKETRPGTYTEFSDVIKVMNDLLLRQSENTPNCQVHEKVKNLTQIIIDTEEVLKEE